MPRTPRRPPSTSGRWPDMIVLDTAAVLCWVLDPGRLSPAAARVIADADRILVSSISVWELAIKVRRGRLVLPVSVSEFAALLNESCSVEVVSVDELLWLENVDIAWDHRDPADRTVVALAGKHRCPLVASDRVTRHHHAASVW